METSVESAWWEPTVIETYKTVGDVSLTMHIFLPEGAEEGAARPAIVFFFGGGWSQGSPTQFYPHCAHLARRGMVAMAAEYRVESRHGVSPDACMADAKSAMRWARLNAERLRIDVNRIAAGGGSAGGHLAACTALVPGFDDPADDLSVSPRPAALVLFNPVIDPTVGHPALAARLGEHVLALSPYHHIAAGAPPCVIFHGMADVTVPIESIERFTGEMTAAGNRCVLHAFEGEKHGFFNYDHGNRKPTPNYLATLQYADDFLVELGYLPSA